VLVGLTILVGVGAAVFAFVILNFGVQGEYAVFWPVTAWSSGTLLAMVLVGVGAAVLGVAILNLRSAVEKIERTLLAAKESHDDLESKP